MAMLVITRWYMGLPSGVIKRGKSSGAFQLGKPMEREIFHSESETLNHWMEWDTPMTNEYGYLVVVVCWNSQISL